MPRSTKDAARARVYSTQRAQAKREKARKKAELEQETAALLHDIADFSALSIQANRVLYEAFGGSGMLCNPEAIFNHLLNDPDYAEFEHVWALTDVAGSAEIVEKFAAKPNVHFVEIGTRDYYRELATCEYLINNTSFPHAFSKRSGQIYFNTWHGSPVKKMGYDVEGGREDARNVMRNFLHADYLLSASPSMTDQMWKAAFRLEGIFRGQLIVDGYPRIERGLRWARDRPGLDRELASWGIELDPDDERPLVVYAPTWRGASPYAAQADIAAIEDVAKHMLDRGVNFRVKVHQFVYEQVKDTHLADILIPNHVPTNLVLARTDILISDYSSIFVDYLVHGRPVLFFLPDADSYIAERGVLVAPADLPGPVIEDARLLAQEVASVAGGTAMPDIYRARLEEWKAKYNPYEDGLATRRVCATVFGGTHEGSTLETLESDKVRLLIYVGGMIPNGISTSIINLLKHLDYSRFDVTVQYQFSRSATAAKRLDDRTRALPRVGRMALTRQEGRARKRFESRGLTGWGVNRAALESGFRREWERCFGAAQFDHVIDFSGYSGFWALLLAMSGAPRRSIWLHNDLALDTRREIGATRPHQRNLECVFSVYQLFDTLVSVSPTLATINKAKLGHWAPQAEFVTIGNALDGEHVVANAAGVTASDYQPPSPIMRTVSRDNRISRTLVVHGADGLQNALWDLEDNFGEIPVDRAIRHRSTIRKWIGEDYPGIVFITVGRLSPEKGHMRMIKAFAMALPQLGEAKLVIVGGGPLYADLKRYAARHEVGKRVVLTGHQENPHGLMAAADCFVFSSKYEGQGLAVLEARILGLPIVSTRFNVVDDVLPEGQGLLAEPLAANLAEAMVAYAEGAVPPTSIDVDAYNAEIFEQVDSLFAGPVKA